LNSSTGDGDWVSIAVLGRTRGIRGELTATSLSSHPERFQQLNGVRLLGDALPPTPLEVERVWTHDGTLIFKFRGIDSINDAEKFRGAEVQVPASERVELEPGEFYFSDLTGCELRDRVSNRLIGRVTGTVEYGGPALLEIDGGRILVPFVKAICTDIRPADGVILADLPEGLEEL